MFKKKSRSDTDDGKVSLSFSIEVETHNAGKKKKALVVYKQDHPNALVCMYDVIRLLFSHATYFCVGRTRF